MVLYKDLNKTSADILSKDFPHEKDWEVEAKTFQKDILFTCQAFANDGKFDVNQQFRYGSKDVTLEGKVFRSGVWSLDAKFANEGMKGCLLNAKLEQRGKGKQLSAEVATEYLHPRIHARIGVLPMTKLWSASSVTVYDKVKVGGELTGNLNMTQVSYSVGGSYTAPDGKWIASVKTVPENNGGNPLKNVLLHLHTKSGDAEVGAEVSHAIKDQSTNVTFAGKYKINKETLLKARIGQDAKIAFALTHRFTDLLTGTMGCQFDGLNQDSDKAIKYGVKIHLTQ